MDELGLGESHLPLLSVGGLKCSRSQWIATAGNSSVEDEWSWMQAVGDQTRAVELLTEVRMHAENEGA